MRCALTVLLMMLTVTAGAATVDREQSAVWIEAEAAALTDGIDTRHEPLASGDMLLGVHCDKTPGVRGQWSFQAGAIPQPVSLFLRYATVGTGRFDVAIDGQSAGRITLPASSGWGHKEGEWAWSAFQLKRDLAAGSHTLALQAAEGSGPLNLDCLGLARGGAARAGLSEAGGRGNGSGVKATVALPEWIPGAARRQPFEIGNRAVLVYGGGDKVARFYPEEKLPAAFMRTLEIEQWPDSMKGRTLEWIFTGPEGGFTVGVTDSSVVLTQRYYNSYGLPDLGSGKGAFQRHPEKKWLEESAAYQGALKAVTVELGSGLEVAVKLNGQEVLRQPCLFDVYQHQVRLAGTGEGLLRGALLTPPPREATVKIDPQQKFQTMLGFGGIGTPMAYAMLSAEGKRRWWELIAQYNLLIQREYPIGTRLSPALDNWDKKEDATPHYYADNFPNGEMSDFDYIKKIRSLGGMVWFEFWGLPPWTQQAAAPAGSGKKKARRAGSVILDKYAGALVNYCQTSQRKAGAPPEVLGIQNEVGHGAEEYQQMTLALRRALDQAGFQGVKIHLSDDGNLKGGIGRAQAVRASEEAWRATDYVASHVYDYQNCLENLDKFDETIVQWNAAAGGKPFLSTEICVNSAKYQVPSYRLALGLGQLYHKNLALMNAEAICYCWTILNVVQPSYGWTRSLFVPDLARGGMPAPSSNQLRVFGAYSRRVKRGMTRVAAESGDKDLLATAFIGKEGATMVLLNRGVSPCTVSLEGMKGNGEFTEMEITDPYRENAVQQFKEGMSGKVTIEPGMLVTLTNVPLGRLPEGFGE